jgi:hypothetical protein
MRRPWASTAPALLFLILLAVARPAHADDPPADPGSDSDSVEYDPADANQDGTVTNRERRRYNRKQRRAASSQDDNSAVLDGQTAMVGSTSGAPSSGAGQSAMGKAAAAASSMKSSMVNPDAVGGMTPGAGAGGMGGKPDGLGKTGGAGITPGGSKLNAASAQAAASVSGSTGNVGDPRSTADFALASRSGYASAFAAAGLKMSPDGKTVLRLDGSAASPDDLARLRRQIDQMPQALTRRPDFFSVVSPEHYSDLKGGYHSHPELSGSVYKDVGTTPQDRDFVRTNSCDKASGDCNENSEKASYKKGEFVPPEDLDKMWADLQKKLDEEDKGEEPGEGRAAGATGEAALETLGLPADAGTLASLGAHAAPEGIAVTASKPAPAPAAAGFAGTFAGAQHWAQTVVDLSLFKTKTGGRSLLLPLLVVGGVAAIGLALVAGRN